MQATTSLRRASATDQPTPRDMAQRIGAGSAIVAGVAYLPVRSLLEATLQDGGGSEPLLRIGAVLLGGGALPPYGELDTSTMLVSLLVFLGVAAVYGSLLGPLFKDRSLGSSLVLGAAAGAAIYLVHYYLVAPSVFPWFTEARGLVTALAHVFFGLMMAVVFNRWWPKVRP